MLRELVRYATLAPSSHNTQCWKFRIEASAISILPDFSRRCPAVDPDDHHLFVSIGCAAENLVQAALAHGLHTNAWFDSSSGGKLHLSLEKTRAVGSPLFNAIPERQSTRGEYDAKRISTKGLALLETAGLGNGVLAEQRVMSYVAPETAPAVVSNRSPVPPELRGSAKPFGVTLS